MKKQFRFCYLKNGVQKHQWQDDTFRPFFEDHELITYRNWWWEESWMIEDEFHREYTDIVVLADDLTNIQGIGTRAMEVLNNAHIYTFLQLGFTTQEELKQILVDANMSKFRDPSKWPTKAMDLYRGTLSSQSKYPLT